MNTPVFIAKRYLFSKKSVNAINFISGISMLGVFVGSAALIIILSVFNGFESLVLSMYNKLTPEIRIEPEKGKTFNPDSAYFTALKKDPRIANYTEVLQEKALLRYGQAQYIGLVKGVSEDFVQGKHLDSALTEGAFILKSDDQNYAVIGAAVQAYLTVNVKDDFRDLEIYSPRKGGGVAMNPADEFVLRTIHPVGVFEPQQQFDDMVLVPLDFAKELFGEENKVSAIEINLKSEDLVAAFQKDLKKALGDNFIVKNRIQQNQLLYKILTSEKWAIFLILTFVLIIAIFNIIGSLTMLVIDKRKDIAILNSMGASPRLVRSIFFMEGMMISMIGCVAGISTGLIFCLLQQRFGFITMNEANMAIDAYPIALKGMDFILVSITVLSISAIASIISSRLSVKNIGQIKDDL